jgi:hypothetical protein
MNQINGAGATAPTVGTVWNEAYAVDECGKFQPAITHAKNPEGITTGNGDGIIHIHPTTKASAGKNATLGKFADAVGMKLNAAELQLPGGKQYVDGDTCQGKSSHVYVKEFAFAGDTTGTLQNVDPRNIRLQDQSLLTIAFVPASEKDKIPPPPAYAVNNLNKLAATSPSPTTTTPGSTGSSSSTTPTTASPTSTTVKK